MATAVRLVPVAEFLHRPEVPGGYDEVRRGDIVMVAWPKHGHVSVQYRIRGVLKRAIGDKAIVHTEMAFRALPEFDIRLADVGVITAARWELADANGYTMGAPEFVMEVESRSNTAREFREKGDVCLANGSIAFWVVYPDLREITVAYAEGSRTYRDGEAIELRGMADCRVAVSELLGPAQPPPTK